MFICLGRLLLKELFEASFLRVSFLSPADNTKMQQESPATKYIINSNWN